MSKLLHQARAVQSRFTLYVLYICKYVQYFRLQVRMQGRWSAGLFSLPYHAETTWLGRRLLETRQAIFFVFFLKIALRAWAHRIRKQNPLPQTESNSFELFFFFFQE